MLNNAMLYLIMPNILCVAFKTLKQIKLLISLKTQTFLQPIHNRCWSATPPYDVTLRIL